MNKSKLVHIIVKDLEELKILSEEVAATEDDSSFIIDLALGKARLLCQEIELLREFTGHADSSKDEYEEDAFDDEASDMTVSDPELEIASPEDQEEEQENEEEETDDAYMDEDDEFQEPEDESSLDEDEEEELTEHQVLDFEPGSVTEEETEDGQQEDDNVAEPLSTHFTVNEEVKKDDIKSSKTTSPAPTAEQPIMREIPKPESPAQEKVVVGETFHKERSLNDAMGENKQAETSLGTGPISSLKAAIGLNDRYLFIREIFGKNADKYNMVIDHLDKLETIQEAVEYLKANLSLQKNDTSLKFVDLLKRRFSK